MNFQVFGICCSRDVVQPANNETDTRKADAEEEKPASENPEEPDIRATCQLEESDKNLVSC